MNIWGSVPRMHLSLMGQGLLCKDPPPTTGLKAFTPYRDFKATVGNFVPLLFCVLSGVSPVVTCSPPYFWPFVSRGDRLQEAELAGP